MNFNWKCIQNASIALLLLTGAWVAAAENAEPIRIVGGHRWGFGTLTGQLRSFCREREVPHETFAVDRWSDYNCARKFTEGDADILLHYELTDVKSGTEEDGRPQHCERFIIGQAKAAIVAPARGRFPRMSMSEVRGLLRAATKAEKEKRKRRWAVFSESKWRSISGHVLRRSCMLLGDDYSGPFYVFRDDMNVLPSPTAVAGKVARSRRTVGTLLWEDSTMPGVKPLPIGKTEEGPFVIPSSEPIIQEDYPLSEYVVLYLKPDAPKLAREFCEFVVGKEGSKIATEAGLFTPYRQRQHEEKKRLREARLGRGERVTAVAVGGGRALMGDLAAEYVRAKEAIRLSCVPFPSERYAMRGFLGVSMREYGEKCHNLSHNLCHNLRACPFLHGR